MTQHLAQSIIVEWINVDFFLLLIYHKVLGTALVTMFFILKLENQ